MTLKFSSLLTFFLSLANPSWWIFKDAKKLDFHASKLLLMVATLSHSIWCFRFRWIANDTSQWETNVIMHLCLWCNNMSIYNKLPTTSFSLFFVNPSIQRIVLFLCTLKVYRLICWIHRGFFCSMVSGSYESCAECPKGWHTWCCMNYLGQLKLYKHWDFPSIP